MGVQKFIRAAPIMNKENYFEVEISFFQRKKCRQFDQLLRFNPFFYHRSIIVLLREFNDQAQVWFDLCYLESFSSEQINKRCLTFWSRRKCIHTGKHENIKKSSFEYRSCLTNAYCQIRTKKYREYFQRCLCYVTFRSITSLHVSLRRGPQSRINADNNGFGSFIEQKYNNRRTRKIANRTLRTHRICTSIFLWSGSHCAVD